MKRGLHMNNPVEDIVGLDWSDGEITAARVDVSPLGAVRLLHVGSAHVPAGASDDAVVAALRELWRSAGMPSHTVAASLRSRSVVVRPFSYPALQPEEFRAAVRLEAEETLQLRADEIALDWHLNQNGAPSEVGKAGRPFNGLLVAAPLREVENHQRILQQAGLFPVILELGATAVANLYQATHREPKACDDVCVLLLTPQSAEVAILFEGDGLYARTLYARGGSWDQSVQTLIEGVQDALKYFVFKLRGRPVRKLVVTGRLPAQADFLDVVRSKTDVPVEAWDPVSTARASSARVRAALQKGMPSSLAISMGLSLRRYASD